MVQLVLTQSVLAHFLQKDDLVLFDRNNHKSLYNSALVMSGAKPVYIPTDRNALGLIGEMDPNFLSEEKLEQRSLKLILKRLKLNVHLD